MANSTVSPPTSANTSPSTSPADTTSLKLDLTTLPPLITPSPPTNTLLITNLLTPDIFTPSTLAEIRSLIDASAPLHAFSPLKSLRRIICSFHTVDDAIRIRQLLDGEFIMGNRVRIYFGEQTPIVVEDQHLAAPKSQKLFFISPPPSPPFGWEVREEAAPNKEVVAEDLARALAGLKEKKGPRGDLDAGEVSSERLAGERGPAEAGRTRSGSRSVVYHPGDHGDSPLLPAVMVEDTTEEHDAGLESEEEKKIMAHTARPPVELMGDA